MRFHCKKLGYTTVTNTLRVKKVCSKCEYWDLCLILTDRNIDGSIK